MNFIHHLHRLLTQFGVRLISFYTRPGSRSFFLSRRLYCSGLVNNRFSITNLRTSLSNLQSESQQSINSEREKPEYEPSLKTSALFSNAAVDVLKATDVILNTQNHLKHGSVTYHVLFCTKEGTV